MNRVAPVLLKRQAKRFEQRQQQKQRRKETQIRRTQEYYTVADVNLRDEMLGFLKLPALKGLSTPELQIRRASRKPRTRLGFASFARRLVHIVEYPGIDAHDVRETLLHELVHLKVGPHPEPHGPKFRSVLRQATEQAFGIRPRLEKHYHGEISKTLREQPLCGATDDKNDACLILHYA
jgi:hypothetical protein